MLHRTPGGKSPWTAGLLTCSLWCPPASARGSWDWLRDRTPANSQQNSLTVPLIPLNWRKIPAYWANTVIIESKHLGTWDSPAILVWSSSAAWIPWNRNDPHASNNKHCRINGTSWKGTIGSIFNSGIHDVIIIATLGRQNSQKTIGLCINSRTWGWARDLSTSWSISIGPGFHFGSSSRSAWLHVDVEAIPNPQKCKTKDRIQQTWLAQIVNIQSVQLCRTASEGFCQHTSVSRSSSSSVSPSSRSWSPSWQTVQYHNTTTTELSEQ